MESVHSIKQRLGSIRSTEQITKSMRLISTTKVQKAAKRLEGSHPFFSASAEMASLALRFAGACTHPFVMPKPAGCTALVVISSDRGLCGAYNANVCKEAYAQIKGQPNAVCVTVGIKARDYLRRRKRIIEHAFRGTAETPYYDDAEEISRAVLDLYMSGRVDKVLLTYTKYESLLLQAPQTVQLLPFCLREEDPPHDEKRRAMNFEPSIEQALDYIGPMHVQACLYGAMLDASASEQSARLMSMDAAEKNCGEMIDKLSLKFNRLRQGAITQELTEIVGGAQALDINTDGEE